ncbi:MAG: MBL fold metallo-hydrolase [Holosporales bacterium]|jgi:phosphoribosyl 1,2-cyclic phosphate phosphodiesterase
MITRITILGCGGSGGVPLPGGVDGRGYWGACDPANPRNRRRRTSALIEHQGVRFLIDLSPDLREQLLSNRITAVDAILMTHTHADHCHGIDDVRSLNFIAKAAVNLYAPQEVLTSLGQRFGYVFTPLTAGINDFYKPSLTPTIITPPMPFSVGDVIIKPFWQLHGKTQSVGYRFGNVAYSTDMNGVPPESDVFLHNLDVWVLDCLQPEPHYSHSHLALSLELITHYKPKRTILIHMNHTLDYAKLAAALPSGIEPGFDGMVVEVP